MAKNSRNWFQKTGEYANSGFGNKTEVQGDRLLNHDGSFNVEKVGLPRWRRMSLYHELINMSLFRFTICLFGSYFLINAMFAVTYCILGIDGIEGINPNGAPFWEAFYFSTQTFTTVGYGALSPADSAISFVASVEALFGLLGFALATGLVYGRFSRPQAKIMYSDNAIVAPYREGTGLMFRAANARDSQMTEVSVKVIFSAIDPESGKRKFGQVPLEISAVNFLPTSWTIVHPIDEESPMWQMTQDEFEKADFEFLILMGGFDDTFSQTVSSRTSYKKEEIIWNARFIPIASRSESGKTQIDLSQLNNFKKL